MSAWALRDQVPYVTEINETVALCWEQMAEGTTEEALVRLMLEEYEVEDEALVRADIRCLLGQLCEGGYIETC